VEADVLLESGVMGRAAVPSGASTARARRSSSGTATGSATSARGVLKPVEHINTEISEAIMGLDARSRASSTAR